MTNEQKSISDSVQDYYGKTLQSSSDLLTNACCSAVDIPNDIKSVIGQIHADVVSQYYGCGLVIPTQLEGLKVLDLGSGTGRDCYILSKLVGKNGFVTGVDMTPEQLEIANRHIDYHTKKFDYSKPNINFLQGHLERLDELGLKQNSFDLIISNCVINLVENKLKVLKDSYDLLKQGGEIYFSDVYSDRRIGDNLKKDPVLYGECLSGALYWNDFLKLARRCGFSDPRLVESAPIEIQNEEIKKKLGEIQFFSVTYRLFKIEELEHDCEDFGQAIIYKGGLSEQPNAFVLDEHHEFEKSKVVPVCGNTFLMLKNSRYNKYFEYIGDFSNHFGIFPGCGTEMPYATTVVGNNTQASCC